VTYDLLQRIDHGPTRTVVLAERQVLAGLHPGCHAPVGVYAKLGTYDTIRLIGFLADPDGHRPIRREVAGPEKDADGLAVRLVEEILTAGGADILKALENV
jgi:hydroxymethylbilane synthase